MPSRAVIVLSIFFVIAAVCFALALMSLARADDVMALLLAIGGALSLRGLHLAARAAEGSAR